MTPPSPLAVTGPQPFVGIVIDDVDKSMDNRSMTVFIGELAPIVDSAFPVKRRVLVVPLSPDGSAPSELVERLAKALHKRETTAGWVEPWSALTLFEQERYELMAGAVLTALGVAEMP